MTPALEQGANQQLQVIGAIARDTDGLLRAGGVPSRIRGRKAHRGLIPNRDGSYSLRPKNGQWPTDKFRRSSDESGVETIAVSVAGSSDPGSHSVPIDQVIVKFGESNRVVLVQFNNHSFTPGTGIDPEKMKEVTNIFKTVTAGIQAERVRLTRKR